MEIIEKQVEKVKEVPADNYGYNYGRRDINGKANAGLTLGIIGTALGAWALFGGRRSASLLGGTGTGSGADDKAKEICERYRGVIPVSATPTDVYVAINSQYHDYVELFKSWFGDNVDQKIIESAIIFWFKDVDCKSRNKVVSYFKEY